MTIGKFETFIEEAREEFRNLISMYIYGGKREKMKDMIKNKINECDSEFEVEVLKENLQEEFKMYLGEL